MDLQDLGFNAKLEQFIKEKGGNEFEPARVLIEHRERFIVATPIGEYEAEITGNLRFTAESRADFPAVGDWVGIKTWDREFAIIHFVCPRSSAIKRKMAGKTSDVQLIAANIDYAVILVAAGRDFNLNRIERYLSICNTSGIIPILVLNKTDLVDNDQRHRMIADISARMPRLEVYPLSLFTGEGLETIRNLFSRGKTYCLLGSSGTGKSSLINVLTGKAAMKTGEISKHANRGKHVTSHRELVFLSNGAMLIDNPGIREVGLTNEGSGLEATFDQITALSETCRYSDCSHTGEDGCAVKEALNNQEISRELYENYLKLLREKSWFETSLADKKRKEKVFGKILKNYQKMDVKRKGNLH